MKELKCEMCEICDNDWIDNLDDDAETKKGNIDSIRQTNKCIDCQEEFSFGYADREC